MSNLDVIEQRLLAAKSEEDILVAFMSSFKDDEIIFERQDSMIVTETTSKNNKNSETLRAKGNTAYWKKEYDKALRLYTESISCAPLTDANSISSAYANRSIVLRVLGRFTDCLVDIERAFSHGYPAAVHHKLLVRKAECHRDLNEPEKAAESFRLAEESLMRTDLPEVLKEQEMAYIRKERAVGCQDREVKYECRRAREVPALSYGASSEAPAMSQAVRIEHNQTFGRHVVATRDIAIGDVLLAERPVGLFVYPQFRKNHCHHCLARCLALLPCQTCDWALYCGEACRDEASARYHRLECLTVPRYLFLGLEQDHPVSTFELFAIRVLNTIGLDNLTAFLEAPEEGTKDPRTKGFNAAGVYDSGDVHSLFNLETNFSKRRPKDFVNNCLTALHIVKYFRRGHDPRVVKLGGAILKLLLCLNVNAHGISELQFEGGEVVCNKVAGGIYPTASLVSHSCVPNVIGTCYGTTFVYRAIRPIKKGAQVTFTYGVTFDKHPKAERISRISTYFFECTCEACVNDWPMLDSLPLSPQFSRGEHQLAKKVNKLKEKIETVVLNLSRSQGNREIALAEVIRGLEPHTQLYMAYLNLLHSSGQTLNQNYLRVEGDLCNFFQSQGNCFVISKR